MKLALLSGLRALARLTVTATPAIDPRKTWRPEASITCQGLSDKITGMLKREVRRKPV